MSAGSDEESVEPTELWSGAKTYGGFLLGLILGVPCPVFNVNLGIPVYSREDYI
jgi:hypothetical protein